MCKTVILIFSVLLLYVSSREIPLSPCPKQFQYRFDGIFLYGLIRVELPKNLRVAKLNVTLILNRSLPDKDVIRLDLLHERSRIQEDISSNQGGKYLYYKLYSSLLDFPGRLKSIYFNGHNICPTSQDYEEITISLIHKLKNIINQNIRFVDKKKPYGSIMTNVKQYVYSNMNFDTHNQERETYNRDNTTSSYDRKGALVEHVAKLDSQEQDKMRKASNSNNINKLEINEKLTLEKNCGISVLPNQSNKKGDWPWLASIWYNSFNGPTFHCVGNLISNYLILTAAHCILEKGNRPMKAADLYVELGVFNLSNWADNDVVRRNVRNIIIHPDFTGGLTSSNDIALLYFKPVTFTKYIIPVCIPCVSPLFQMIQGIIFGWGVNVTFETDVPRLSIDVIVSPSECFASTRLNIYENLLTDSNFCVGNALRNETCNIDSGGGIFIKIENQWHIVGVESYKMNDPKSNDACKLRPWQIYTNISDYSDWINNYV